MWITISILISPIYSLILYTRIFLGNTNYHMFKVNYFNTFELSIEEIIINIFILSLIIIFGLNPDLIYNFLIKNM
jgi:NADH:ubiquinone oxidoreductase subunit 4 (subunit M)